VYSYVSYPNYNQNFAWSEYCNDGSVLTMSQACENYLQAAVSSLIGTVPVDYVLAVTGFSLFKAVGTPGFFEGYTYQSTICTGSSAKYGMLEYISENPARIAAHLLGHALDAVHDDQAGCTDNQNIMASTYFTPSSGTASSFLTFSSCSASSILSHLSGNSDCTGTSSPTDDEFLTSYCYGFLGGTYTSLSLDLQCQIRTSLATSVACSNATAASCYERNSIACTNSLGSCDHMLDFVWTGTQCDGDGSVCFQGSCVTKAVLVLCTTSTSSTTNAVPPCNCCFHPPDDTKRQNCCDRKFSKFGSDCYCCGSFITVFPPTSTSTSTVTQTTTSVNTRTTTVTLTTVAPCNCCFHLPDETKRQNCCDRKVPKFGTDCYCCGSLITVFPPTDTTTTATRETTTTSVTSSTTNAVPLCNCCFHLPDDTKRQNCCDRKFSKFGSDCYCCGSFITVFPPTDTTTTAITTTVTTTTASPCNCCFYLPDETKRQNCCDRKVIKFGKDCYCCGSLIAVFPPTTTPA